MPEDTKTYSAWKSVGVPSEKLVGLGIEHNYWIQGGAVQKGNYPVWRKSGTNTEIFYDLGRDKNCGPDCLPGCRCGRFVELANSLFISHAFDPQTNQLSSLQDSFTETVIGTERVAMVLQSVPSVFDTESYRPILEKIHESVIHTDLPFNVIKESERIIADHLRALYVLIADGAPPPGKNGRERIIKLLIRGILLREMILGINSSEFLVKNVPIHFPISEHAVLSEQQTQETIQKYIVSESRRFFKTIERGKHKLQEMIIKNKGQTLSGSQILCLEKEWGVPHQLTAMTLQREGLDFLEADYQKALYLWKQATPN